MGVANPEFFLKTMIFSIILMCIGAIVGVFVGYHYDVNPIISVVVTMVVCSLYLGYWAYSNDVRAEQNFSYFHQMRLQRNMLALLLDEATNGSTRDLMAMVADDAPDSELKRRYRELKLSEYNWGKARNAIIPKHLE